MLNKSDFARPEELSEAERILRLINPLAQIQTTSYGRVEPSSVLHLKAFDPEWKPPLHQHQHSDIQSFTLRATRPLHPARLNTFVYEHLVSRPGNLLRAKGFLSVRGYDEYLLFQSVREIFTLERTDRPSADVSQLVVIGRGLEQAVLERAFVAVQT